MKSPKILYRYQDTPGEKKIFKHYIMPEENCCPQIVAQVPHGTLWRCRTSDHDEYGYCTRLAAVIEERQNIVLRIAADTLWQKKLTP